MAAVCFAIAQLLTAASVHTVTLSVSLVVLSVHAAAAESDIQPDQSAAESQGTDPKNTEDQGGEQQEPPLELPRVHLEPRHSLIEALKGEVSESQQVFLKEGGSENAGESDFLALYRPNNQAQPMGAVLIVHDAGQHADWPRIVRPLRLELADYGWHTLAITLPSAPDRQVPERVFADKGTLFTTDTPAPASEQTGLAPDADVMPDDPAQAADPGNNIPDLGIGDEQAMIQLDAKAPGERAADEQAEGAPDVFETHAVRRIDAGVAYLQDLGIGNIVLLGVGDGARLATLYLAENPQLRGAQGTTLIWVNPRLQPEERSDFKHLLGEAPYPRILDVMDASDFERREDAKERLRSARRLRLPSYAQINLPLRSSAWGHRDDALVQRLRGWLETNAPGEERRKAAGTLGP